MRERQPKIPAPVTLGSAVAFGSRSILRRHFVKSCVVAVLGLLALTSVAPVMAAGQVIHLSVDASKPGATINRNIFGQFAENLGHDVVTDSARVGDGRVGTDPDAFV